MAASYTLNLATLKAAAAQTGDTWSDGRLHLARMARRSGIDPGVLSRITRGENGPSPRTLVLLAKAYHLTVDKLIRTD